MTINILHLYPAEMNLYGDHGNVLALKKRCEWRGIKTKIINYEPGDEIPDNVDIIFGGGGQDSSQSKIEKDLQKIAPKLKEMIENNTPALVICGIYQLFGNYFETNTGQKIQGASILDLYTKGEDERLIGTVISGAGNNGKDFTEGIKYHNCIGTYLHGPILPKNPRVADFLIRKALENKTKKFQKLEPLNDALERKAHKSAAKRPR